jgi:putative nucleotidyltransferase with HDIG domain
MNARALQLVDADVRADPSPGRAVSHGARLLSALAAVDRLPVLEEARREFAALAGRAAVSDSALVVPASSDPGLAAALLRFANRYTDGPAVTPQAAISQLGRERARAIALELPVYTFTGAADPWTDAVRAFTAHGLAVARRARRIAREVSDPQPERAATAALFHDVGRLVMVRTHNEAASTEFRGATPAQRVAAELHAVGVDHAAIGGVVARRWSFPRALSSAIEHHHSPEAGGISGIVRLADMLVHHAAGARIAAAEMLDAAGHISLPERALASIMAEADGPPPSPEAEPCPLTPRQLELIRALAQGRQYKEIAHDLGISPSTIRSHLHFAYERLGVADRAQAVLIAVSRGWIGPVAISTR